MSSRYRPTVSLAVPTKLAFANMVEPEKKEASMFLENASFEELSTTRYANQRFLVHTERVVGLHVHSATMPFRFHYSVPPGGSPVQKWVTIVETGNDEGLDDCCGCFDTKDIADPSDVVKMVKCRAADISDVGLHAKVLVEDSTKITCRTWAADESVADGETMHWC